ncbi:uncharacterized protein LOC128211461 isoform X1 [Mya arenaria]|uniref:uncharacterized protein LOC128211461 isoform X1 n=2 Tax=Mya arenaria TaxID=6604 RepID=UPI0022E4113B|nr:uncharacterized protein LOC128211461 isoform X1 [Mya arenaria]
MGGRIELHLLFCLAACVTSMVHAQTSVQIEYDFSDRDIRLAGGDSNLDGRVEKRVNGIWGTVCHGSFGMNDAQVVCQMLSSDLSAIHIINDTTYGPGNGPIFYNHLDCTGSETSIDECSSITGEQCEHHQDVAVVCSICPRAANFYYGDFSSVDMTIRGQEYHGLCSNGTYTYNFTYLCLDNGTWIPTHNSCGPLNITSVRLVDGVGLYDGIVQVLVGDTWGAICGYSYWSTISLHRAPEYTLSKLICNEIGGTYITFSWEYRNNEVQMMDQTICSEPYESLADCKYDTVTTCYYHYYSACNVYPLNITGIRLSGGGYPQIGRIELQVQGQWGRICGDFFDINNAAVLCRMMGLNSSAFMRHDNFVQGSGPLLMNYVHCYGSEEHINNCSYSAPYINSCTSNNDISLLCTECGVIDFRNGNIVLYNSSTNVLTVECQSGITIEYICLSNGTWMSNEECPPLLQDIRLVDGVGIYDGRVEVLYNGTWGTICYNNYRYQNTDVICRMLGAIPYSHSRHAGGTGRIHIENLNCVGQENDLSACEYDDRNECSHSNDLGVTCYLTNRPLNVTGIRLADGTSKYDGRVEIQENYDYWGTVCDNWFDFLDGNTLCRMMNMSLLDYYGGSRHGPGTGPMTFGDLFCEDGNSHIQDCHHTTPYYCSLSETVSLLCSECGPPQEDGEITYSINGTIATVHCHFEYLPYDPVIECFDGNWSQIGVCDFYGPPLNISSVRLVDGDSVYEGRVEIEVDGTYGTICDSLFDLDDADVICKSYNQNYGAAYYFAGARHGEGTGPIHIDRLFCGETNTSLFQCPYHSVGFCDHSRDVSVVCNECGQPDIAFWGIGYFTYNGSALFADCSYYKTYVGELKMTCDHANGAWVTEGECQEYSRPLNIQDVRLSGGQSDMEGRVEIKSMDTWGTICKNGFGIKEADVICNMFGFPPAQAVYLNGEYSAGTGPIFVDDLSCGLSDTHINNCSYVTYDNCSHLQDVAVKCTVCDDFTPNNGSINGTQFVYGTVLEVSCNYGHFLVGDQYIHCQRNATWSSRPECPLIDCGDPTPENGRSNVSQTTLNEVVEIACVEGYNITGSSIIQCQENRRWSDDTICVIVDCGPLEAEHTYVDIENITTFGEAALVSCNTGYLPEGTTPVECLANGTWSEIPSCRVKDCGDPTPSRGQRNNTVTTYGTVVLISCDEGLEVTGNSVIKCRADGTWSDNPVCDSSDCGPPSVANGHVTTSGNTTFGNNATIVCNEGYSLDGSGEILCTAYGWENVSCVLQDCGNLTIDNGKVLFDTGTKFGDSAEVHCFLGYDLNGDSKITCLDGSLWSDNPICDIKKCPVIELSTNGFIDEPYSTTFGSTVTFKCNVGFLLVGEMAINCESSGEWSANFPSCVQKSSIGGACDNKNYCLAHNAECNEGVCSCKTGIYDDRTKYCDSMPLFPFLNDSSKNVAVTQQCSNPIRFLPGIPVFERMRYEIYVCSNGYISFDKPHSNPTPPNTSGPNDSDDNGFSGVPIIAPFYAGINKQTSQSISYRTIDILNDFPFSEEQKSDLEMVKSIVMKSENLTSFEPKFLLIADWNKVSPLPIIFQSSSVASFQLAIVSDGLKTLSMFIYPKDLMNWTVQLNSVQNVNVWVGTHNADTKITRTNPFSFKPIALQMDKLSSTNNVSGLLLTKIGEWKSHDVMDCIHWYKQHNTNKNTYHEIMFVYLPECPCDLNLARFDPWYWRIGRKIRRFWWQSVDDFEGDVVCVDMWHRSIFDPYGKSCCYYRKSRRFVEGRPVAGGLYHYHPSLNASQHDKYDVEMKEKCCSSDFCELYYQLHPIGTCYTRSPYSQGNFWGDPHISTLDRMNYTFNGLGEYTLLLTESNNTWFTLQARTERAVKHDGNLSDATIFSAFAAKDHTNASLHVELNSAKQGLILYGDGLDFTRQFLSGEEYDSTTLSISNNNGSARVFFKNTGIMLDIGVGVEMLSLSTTVPSTYANITRGILGNFDGDPSNDLKFPNETILNSSSSEREIFFYGQTWAVNERTTVFFYEDEKDHDNFHNSSYVPLFLDEVDNVTMALAVEACNGTLSTECIYDFALTLNPAIAADTVNRKQQFDQDQEEIDKVIPTIEGCNVVNVTVGENVTCTVNVDDNIDIQVLGNNTYNATFNRLSSTITYTHTGDISSPLRYQAVNQEGLASVEHVISVVVCTGCNNHGRCTPVLRVDRDDDNFRYYECECQPGYDGINCESTYDGCAGKPCSLGRTCTDLSPEEQQRQGRAYMCSECPLGYTAREDDDNVCIDIDECASKSSCQQSCINTEGSFICVCEQGLQQDRTNFSACRDMNECEDESHNCSQVCVNLYGGFRCECRTGFVLKELTGQCLLGDVNPCASAIINCTNTAGCTVDEYNTTKCFCERGFELDDSGENCKDIDECLRHICPQECINFSGGFECTCLDGYRLEGISTCSVCEIPYYGHECNNTCECTGRGAIECNPVRGCMCDAGWIGSTCDDDINECDVDPDICADVRKYCTNTVGSYTCDCINGYEKNDEDACIDVDECADASLHGCQQMCLNNIGSYSCDCRVGYVKINGTSCQDVDECAGGTATCAQMCENKPGSYNCYCHFGYKLSDDRRACTQISDPCRTLYNLTCLEYCVVKDNTAECRCRQGFVLGEDAQTCLDVNECQNIELNGCDSAATCMNTDGSYQCECPIGARLENDGRTCTECDEFHFGRDCSKECSCIKGICNNTRGCICEIGWTGPNCDVDIDECALNAVNCILPYTQCVNAPGSAACQCKTGYTADEISGECLDIDECVKGSTHDCEQYCNNTDGSYECSCRHGFLQNGGSCTDINECNGAHNCEHQCENIVGSFKCFCDNGYRLNLADRQSCIPENECSDVQRISCPQNATCAVTDGSFDCTCPKGFCLINGTCNDINECQQETDACTHQCSNKDGGYVCSCDTGSQLLSDGFTCRECSDWRYGQNCASPCLCNEDNTQSCNGINGECSCKAGWMGTTCAENVNECSVDGSNNCPDNSSCVDTPGSFECVCNTGYLMNGYWKCQECQQGYYGQHCVNTCACNALRTKSCNHVTGTCACDEGWTGKICDEDVDECGDQSLNTCTKFSECSNTFGRYLCNCNKGYKTQPNSNDCSECLDFTFGWSCNETCACQQEHSSTCDNVNGSCSCLQGWKGEICSEDVDECSEKPKVCSVKDNSHCENVDGSYLCSCDAGYNANDDICEDVKECLTEELNDCDERAVCVETDGNYTCLCPVGMHLQDDGRSCIDCDENFYGLNCSKLCKCEHGYCNKTSGCHCDSGWTGIQCDIDKDECKTGDLVCEDPNTVCKNTIGSANCVCQDGYERNKTTEHCNDIDECKEGEWNKCTQTCTNTAGGYSCGCDEGYSYSRENNTCNDDDECHADILNDCDQSCHNTDGGYVCECEQGFFLDVSDNKTCLPVTSCTEKEVSACPNHSVCYRNRTELDCRCNKGYFKDNNEQCKDEDECSNSSPCAQHCNNTAGSFSCSCDIGFKLIQATECEECEPYTFGQQCELSCNCDQANALSCDALNGTCACAAGWTGDTCTENVNECEGQSSIACPEHSHCADTPGNYSCLCNTGYIVNQDGLCDVCEQFRYGDSCESQCSCSPTGADSCDHVLGNCSCKSNWQGGQCNDDVDECSFIENLCAEKSNSSCINYVGSFTCSCDAGYTDKNGACEDVNECDENRCDQGATCQNSDGSFLCICPLGKRLNNDNSCQECSNNTYGTECNQNCNCTFGNTQSDEQSCDRETGTCICNSNWTGDRCETDVNECTTSGICTKANAGCFNLPGGFRCDCLRGYRMNKVTGECEIVGERATVPTAANEVRIDLTIILAVELDPGTDLGVQTVFGEIAAKVKYSMREHFSKFISIEITIVINDMRSFFGSINVNYSITYAKSPQVALGVSQALVDIASGTEIEYDGLNVSATAPESYINDNLCGLYEKALGGCESGYECVIEGRELMCKLLPISDNYLVVVGVTVGLSVFCVAVLIIITSVVVYNRNRKARLSNIHRRGQSEASADEQMNVWPPWKDETAATDPSFNSWRTKALNFGQEHRYVSPYHLPRVASNRTREQSQTPYLAQ